MDQRIVSTEVYFADRHGEVSRAMRNRCIELHLPDNAATQGREMDSPEETTSELLACVAQAGVPGQRLSMAMAMAHASLSDHYAASHE